MIWRMIFVWVVGGMSVWGEDEKHRGVCFVAGRFPPSEQAYDRLAAVGVNWISQTPFGWQRTIDTPEIRMRTKPSEVMFGESDSGLVVTALEAKKRGIQTVLKPHLWIRRNNDGKWRADIDFDSQAKWDVWWDNYRTFMLHYAHVAEESGMEVLCIGTELRSTVVKHPEQWRRLIADIRKIYGGALTYSANWYEEFEEVSFWADLDFIGVQAYFPLKDSRDVAVLKAAWKGHLDKIKRVHDRVGKPVLFTEVGYRSTADAPVEPWLWRSDADVDDELQAVCYEAMMQAVWAQPWLAGIYIWKWFPEDVRPDGDVGDAHRRRSERFQKGFTPQGKLAEGVLARWYGNKK